MQESPHLLSLQQNEPALLMNFLVPELETELQLICYGAIDFIDERARHMREKGFESYLGQLFVNFTSIYELKVYGYLSVLGPKIILISRNNRKILEDSPNHESHLRNVSNLLIQQLFQAIHKQLADYKLNPFGGADLSSQEDELAQKLRLKLQKYVEYYNKLLL